jgi:hypothetical protein
MLPLRYCKVEEKATMGVLEKAGRWNKVWILATVTSYALFALYWVLNAYNRVHLDLIENRPLLNSSSFWLDHVFGAIADTLRIVAVILLIVAAYLTWGPKKQPFHAVKKYLATAIFLEAIFWLAVLPEIIKRIAMGRDPLLLYVGVLLEILAAGPLLLALGIKVWKYKKGTRKDLIKTGCFAGIGYIFAMWIYNMFRWLSMSGIFGAADPRLAANLFSGITALGFLNTALTLTLSLVFAIVGSYMLIKRNNQKRATQLIGIAILHFGLYFALYVLYAWFAPNEWAFVLVLTQIWLASLVGLGIGLLKGKI